MLFAEMDLRLAVVRSVGPRVCRRDGCRSAAVGGSFGRSVRRTLRMDVPRSRSKT